VTVVHDTDAYEVLRRGAVPTAEPEPEGLEVVRLSSGLAKLSTLLTQQLGRPVVHGRTIARVLEQGRFDVINFHNVSLVGGPGLLAMGDAVKLYMTHEHWLVCPTHVLWRHGRELCTGRECLRCVLNYKRPPQLWRSTGALDRGKHVDRFIAMSEFNRAKHKEFGFRSRWKCCPTSFPIGPAPRRRRAREAARASIPYFLFVDPRADQGPRRRDPALPRLHGRDP
jgi:hypothetical protein